MALLFLGFAGLSFSPILTQTALDSRLPAAPISHAYLNSGGVWSDARGTRVRQPTRANTIVSSCALADPTRSRPCDTILCWR